MEGDQQKMHELVDARRVFKAMGEFWSRETPELCKSRSHYTADGGEICGCLDFEQKGEGDGR